VPAFVAAMLVHSPARGETPSPEEPQGAAAPAATQPGQPPPPPKPERYQDGILIWQTPDEAQFPFLLKFNLNTQIRYLNTTDSEDSFTDHLGLAHDVNERNDITVNRTMFILSGYVFDKRLRWSSTVWTSAGA